LDVTTGGGISMGETSLRWKGRLGKLKGGAPAVLLLVAIGLSISLTNLATARANPTLPQEASIREVADGSIARNRYVAIDGYAEYEAAYVETEDGRTTAVYYLLYDDNEGYILVVEADSTSLGGRLDGTTMVSGMTASMPSDLQSLVEEDVGEWAEYGWVGCTTLYLREGATPPSEQAALSASVGLGFVGLLSVVVLFFPRVVFEPSAPQMAGGVDLALLRLGVRASGRFQKLERLRPAIEIGRGSRKLTDAVANVVPLEDRRILIYVHHIVRSGAIKVSEGNYGLVLDSGSVKSAETGKLYGWKDRWAVRLQHEDSGQKPRTVIVSFDSQEGQGSFLGLLRKAGILVGAGLTHRV
jgi:hypothetical protein